MAVATRDQQDQLDVIESTFTAVDDWPGCVDFSDLGHLYRRACLGGVTTIGFFRQEDEEGCVIYAASSRPHVVGVGQGEQEALVDWLEEFTAKWELAKDLRSPFAPAVDNDIEAMGVLMRALIGGTRDA